MSKYGEGKIMTTGAKYINPFTDFGFKKLFGSEVNKELLIDFLNELIKEQGKITCLTFLTSEQLGRSIYDRRAIYDIYCENEKGEKFIVEMQKAKQNYFKDRTLYYSTFPIRDQAYSEDWNFKLNAVYTVGILDFVFDEDIKDKDYLHHEVKLMETTKKEVFYDKLTFIYLEMPKFNKTEEELESRFDKWLYVLKNLPRLESRPAKLQEKVFDKLFKTAELANFNKMERDDYDESLKVYRDMKNVMDTAIEEASKKGKIEGKIERDIEFAINMIKDDDLNEKILRYTGLSLEKIEELRKNLLNII